MIVNNKNFNRNTSANLAIETKETTQPAGQKGLLHYLKCFGLGFATPILYDAVERYGGDEHILLPKILDLTNEHFRNFFGIDSLASFKHRPIISIAKTMFLSDLIFRFGLQEGLLRRLPRAVLRWKGIPEEKIRDLVDSKWAKVARVATSTGVAVLLTVSPYWYLNRNNVYLSHSFAAAFVREVILGAVQEFHDPLCLLSVRVGNLFAEMPAS